MVGVINVLVALSVFGMLITELCKVNVELIWNHICSWNIDASLLGQILGAHYVKYNLYLWHECKMQRCFCRNKVNSDKLIVIVYCLQLLMANTQVTHYAFTSNGNWSLYVWQGINIYFLFFVESQMNSCSWCTDHFGLKSKFLVVFGDLDNEVKVISLKEQKRNVKWAISSNLFNICF